MDWKLIVPSITLICAIIEFIGLIIIIKNKYENLKKEYEKNANIDYQIKTLQKEKEELKKKYENSKEKLAKNNEMKDTINILLKMVYINELLLILFFYPFFPHFFLISPHFYL